MNRIKKSSAYLAVALISLVAIWVIVGGRDPNLIEERSASERPVDWNPVTYLRGNPHETTSREVERVDPHSQIPSTDLNELKRELAEWNSASGGNISPESREFIRQMLSRVLFTPDMLDVMEFVDTKDLRHAGTAVDITLRELLRDSGSTAERRKLLAMAEDSRLEMYAHRWYFYAGEGCSEEEFQALHASVSNPRLARDLEIGRDLTLVRTNPFAAVGSAVAFLVQPGLQSRAYEKLPDILARLPANSDFAAIERLLPANGGNYASQLSSSRDQLLGVWAISDPGAAADYVVSNPERIAPNMISSVLAPFARAQPAKAINWVQDFPPGPYFDAAVSSVVLQICERYPDTARELAALIGDSKMKIEALGMIDLSQNH